MPGKNNNLGLETANEDTVQCFFFSTDSPIPADSWKHKCKVINSTIKNLSQNYIWHRDQFKLHLPIIAHTNDVPPHLASTTCFGDNIEDEWFIVYLVLEITKLYQDLIVQIKDNDGDFLLIEAADYLPSWVNPENSKNRVFLYGNQIHLIPPELVPLDTTLKVEDAITYLIKSTDKTIVSKETKHAIFSRIGNYPEKLKDNVHRAIVELPIDIAIVLTLQPKLIAPIVSAYCSHDAIDVKSCNDIKYENCIAHQVKFTKCLYAMLMHSKLINYPKSKTVGNTDKKKILGLKLTCGFHMIMKHSSSDIFISRDFTTFINNLKGHNYFKHNIEGSKEYTHLLDQAKEFYTSLECSVNSQIAKEISELMTSDIFLQEKQAFKMEPADSNQFEDNDDWLNIHPEQLNDLLNLRYGKPAKFAKDDVISSETVTTELSNFLKQTSDFEGIEQSKEIETDDNTIQFDASEFTDCVEKMLQLLNTDNNSIDHDSDFSDDSENMSQCDIIDEVDEELAEHLQKDPVDLNNSKSILLNIIQSMKEEKASSGPSSNLLSTVGIKKADLLDSDDD